MYQSEWRIIISYIAGKGPYQIPKFLALKSSIDRQKEGYGIFEVGSGKGKNGYKRAETTVHQQKRVDMLRGLL